MKKIRLVSLLLLLVVFTVGCSIEEADKFMYRVQNDADVTAIFTLHLHDEADPGSSMMVIKEVELKPGQTYSQGFALSEGKTAYLQLEVGDMEEYYPDYDTTYSYTRQQEEKVLTARYYNNSGYKVEWTVDK